MEDDRKDLVSMIYAQCGAAQQQIVNSLIGRGSVSDVALKDIRRTLDHLVRSIDERNA